MSQPALPQPLELHDISADDDVAAIVYNLSAVAKAAEAADGLFGGWGGYRTQFGQVCSLVASQLETLYKISALPRDIKTFRRGAELAFEMGGRDGNLRLLKARDPENARQVLQKDFPKLARYFAATKLRAVTLRISDAFKTYIDQEDSFAISAAGAVRIMDANQDASEQLKASFQRADLPGGGTANIARISDISPLRVDGAPIIEAAAKELPPFTEFAHSLAKTVPEFEEVFRAWDRDLTPTPGDIGIAGR